MRHSILKWTIIAAMVILALPQLFQQSREFLAKAEDKATAAWWAALLNLPAKRGDLKAVDGPQSANEKGLLLANNFTFSFSRKGCNAFSESLFETQTARAAIGTVQPTARAATNATTNRSAARPAKVALSGAGASGNEKEAESHNDELRLPALQANNPNGQVSGPGGVPTSHASAHANALRTAVVIDNASKSLGRIPAKIPVNDIYTTYLPGNVYDMTRNLAQTLVSSSVSAREARESLILLKSRKGREPGKAFRRGFKINLNISPDSCTAHGNPA